MDIRRVHIEAMLPWAKPDQDSRQAVTKRGVPRHRPMNALLPQARTQRNIGTAVKDWTQEKRQLSWSIAL
jgi:hypothetical protein